MGKLYFSRDLSISPRTSNFLGRNIFTLSSSFLMSVTSSLNGPPPFIFDVVYLCLLCIILGQCLQGKSGFCDHFPLWVFIFPPTCPAHFLCSHKFIIALERLLNFYQASLFVFSGRAVLENQVLCFWKVMVTQDSSLPQVHRQSSHQ